MTGPRRWLARLGLASALALALSLRAVAPATVEDLRPRPDALEYEEAARNIRDGAGYSLVIEGSLYSPRYPFGFSLLLVPVLWLWDAGPGTGVVVVLACALATVVAAWRLARDAAGPVPAVVAALLVAVSPLHVRLSQVVMSDVPAACATTWLLVGVTAALRRDRRSGSPLAERRGRRSLGPVATWAMLGFGIGLTSLLRISAVGVAVPAALAMLVDREPSRWRRRGALAAGLALGMAPFFAYNLIRFGSPLRSGYDLWVRASFFSWDYLVGPPAGGGSVPNVVRYAGDLGGLGDLYPWPIAALVLLGFVEAFRAGGARAELARLVLAFTAALLALQLLFFWQDPRFLLPLVPPLLCVAALPFAAEAHVALRGTALVLAVAGVALLARSPLLSSPKKGFLEPTKLRQIDAQVPPNAALIAHSTEPFVRRFLRRPGTDRIWVPIDKDELQLARRLSRVAPLGPAEDDGHWIRQGLTRRSARRIVSALLAEGRPVYLSTMLEGKSKGLPGIVDALGVSFRFDVVERDEDGAFLVAISPRRRAWRPSSGSRTP